MNSLNSFDFNLPPALIAQHPPHDRDGGRLLSLHDNTTAIHRINALPALLRADDILVVNDSRVLPARLHGQKNSGGKVEVLAERFLNHSDVLAQVRTSKPLRAGARVNAGGDFVVCGRHGDFYQLRAVNRQGAAVDARRRFLRRGETPLPPYIKRLPDPTDQARYQTVFARHSGSVAAPTAGLHFTSDLLACLRTRGIDIVRITLHVGAGTFQPLRQGLTTDKLHAERYTVSATAAARINTAKKLGRRIIAVGTTVLRTLEAAVDNGKLRAGDNETTLFIKPGFNFRIADMLFTNFHLPRSSLLVLVCAFGGSERIMSAYQLAVQQKLRFYSYGDAMLLDRAL
ncbi:tRNA preQ1(34) S-adenosylmethionine ribosyltransferase-isomerase QueA [Candidatus Persebacteraceae bacterium Df01]|jgi:S-adenosylmethionine:tRNA ribosyltransferase-isomerase|uniref:S-adenosylmethionine:tRNA ribosyltransferase-isomerase n=1 Tax=Candidatus Doriopsillibacter californiensis TaxID=2970740 RepID=A0ABT7QKY2_9GAMM|nr:tRNA preQ1(34) S-adenosylmethionine ribosyltransferase-isomerase QueA [Candidatus Persebacteraceae bacterium Df01]